MNTLAILVDFIYSSVQLIHLLDFMKSVKQVYELLASCSNIDVLMVSVSCSVIHDAVMCALALKTLTPRRWW